VKAAVIPDTAPPRRRRLSRVERSREVLDAAESVIADRGIQASSMDEIAERAGVTKPVVYDHFGSKDGLVAALVLRAGADLATTVLEAVTAAGDPESALAAGLAAYFQFMQDRRTSWSSLLSETAALTSAAAAALEQVRDQQAEVIARLVTADVPGCDLARARRYAQVVVGASERLATRPGASPPSVAVLTQTMMDVIWCGFTGVRDGNRWRRRPSGRAPKH
jgi:AcrR family transcriptional regulator